MKAICEVVKDNGRFYPCNIYGINADIVTWLDSDETLAGKVIYINGIQRDRLLMALGTRNDNDRIFFAADIIKALWQAAPERGSYPLLNKFNSLQQLEEFYPGYRDHIAHQLNVYLLGLYLVFNGKMLRDPIYKEIKKDFSSLDPIHEKDFLEARFVERWIMAALFHDVGYIADGVGHNLEKYQKRAKDINPHLLKLLQFPISNTPLLGCKYNFSENNESRVTTKISGFSPPSEFHLLNVGMFASANSGVQDVLDQINPIGEATNLGTGCSKSIFSTYFEYAAAYPHKSEHQIKDHGIVSARLLLHLGLSYQERLSLIFGPTGQAARDELANWKDLHDCLKKQHNKDSHRIRTNLLAAAGAIAIHNIESDTFNSTVLGLSQEYTGLFPGKYEVLLTDPGGDKRRNQKATALGFLLILTDTLQDYNRPTFRERYKDDHEKEILDLDMSIRPEDDVIHLYLRRDHEEGFFVKNNHSSYFDWIKAELKKKLDHQTVERIMRRDSSMTPELEFSINGNPPHPPPRLDRHTPPVESTSAESQPPFYSENDYQVAQAKTQSLLGAAFSRFEDMQGCCSTCSSKNRNYCSFDWLSLTLVAEYNRSLATLRKAVDVFNVLKSLSYGIRRLKQDFEKNPFHVITKSEWADIHSHILNLFRLFETPVTNPGRLNESNFCEYDRYHQYNQESYQRDQLEPEQRIKKFLTQRLKTLHTEHIDDFVTNGLVKMKTICDHYSQTRGEAFSRVAHEEEIDAAVKVFSLHIKDICGLENQITDYLCQTCISIAEKVTDCQPDAVDKTLYDINRFLPHNQHSSFFIWSKGVRS